jgi:VIT1/CCC1 family predicted Fe2+/Mn2+ transporter
VPRLHSTQRAVFASSAGRSLPDQRRYHAERDPHVRGRWLSDLVLGAQDGIVNTLGVILGVASATSETRVILATGMAAAVAESISMAAVAYTSSLARGDLYRAEREREYRHIERTPDVEREEIRALFREKGFEGELLERAVETICSNRDTWVSVMMAEEHALSEVDRKASLRSAAVVGGASIVASVPPVLPFLALSAGAGIAFGLAIGVALLLALGALKARLTTGSPARSAVALAAIGVSSAFAGYVVGALFAAR